LNECCDKLPAKKYQGRGGGLAGVEQRRIGNIYIHTHTDTHTQTTLANAESEAIEGMQAGRQTGKEAAKKFGMQ
jgi:hypothetical protein